MHQLNNIIILEKTDRLISYDASQTNKFSQFFCFAFCNAVMGTLPAGKIKIFAKCKLF